jgi:hypothetical protein
LQALIFDSKKRNNRNHKKEKRRQTVENSFDEKDEILHISSNGKPSIYPFIYD